MVDRRGRRAAWVAVACGCLASVGCSRVTVEGRVTLDGQPVDGGSISFLPEAAGRRPAWATIRQGRYAIAGKAGLAAGRHRVEIRWPRPTGQKQPALPPATGAVDVVEEAFPPACNTASTLTATLVTGRNTADFAAAAAAGRPAGD